MEAARHHLPAGSAPTAGRCRFARRAGRSGLELGGHGEERVRLGVELHGARARLGGDVTHQGELAGAVFVGHGDGAGAAAVGAESQLGALVEAVGVHTRADRDGGHDRAGVGVHHGHHAVVAADKQPPGLRVHGQAGGSFARRKRPLVGDLERLGVNFDLDAGILHVVVDVAPAVSHGVFAGLAGQIHGARHLAGLGVHRHRFAVVVEGEDAVGGRVIDDAVRALDRQRDFLDGGQRLKVELGHAVAAAVAGETVAVLAGDGDAVGAFQSFNFAHNLEGVGVDHIFFGTGGDVDPATGYVNAEVVPTA